MEKYEIYLSIKRYFEMNIVLLQKNRSQYVANVKLVAVVS